MCRAQRLKSGLLEMVPGVGHGFGCSHREGSAENGQRENETIECVHPVGKGCSEHKAFAVGSRNKLRAIKHELTENVVL